MTSGAASVALARGRNDIVVTATSSDGSTTTSYRVTGWRLAAPSSKIVSVADARATVYGGTRMAVTISNGAVPPNNCFRYFVVVGQYTWC